MLMIMVFSLSTIMPKHPFSDVVQSIHLEHPSPEGLTRFIVSTFPSPAVGEPIVVLYGSGERGELVIWSSKPGKHKVGAMATYRSLESLPVCRMKC